MGVKSIREAVEAAVTAHLIAQNFPAGVQVLPGLSSNKLAPPMVVASVDTVGPHPDIPEGWGNFSATVSVAIVSPARIANAEAFHGQLSEIAANAMADEAGLRAVFVSQNDAKMYFAIFRSQEDRVGEDHFGKILSYELLGVLDPA
jgi:hypothetical protein